MSAPRDTTPATEADPSKDLSPENPDEAGDEEATELPERDAMSILPIGVGHVHIVPPGLADNVDQ